jgi:hypothetical protein
MVKLPAIYLDYEHVSKMFLSHPLQADFDKEATNGISDKFLFSIVFWVGKSFSLSETNPP